MKSGDLELSCVCVRVCVCVCVCVVCWWEDTFGVGESEERAVLAGEFEEHAESKRAIEQLHLAACARASACVQAGSHGMNVVRCMRARLNAWGCGRAVRIASRGYS